MPVSMLEFGAWLTVAFAAFVDVRVQSVITGSALLASLHTRYGVLHITLMIAALAAAIAVSGGRRRRVLLAAAAAVALSSESLAGHAGTNAQPAIAVIADLAHSCAAAVAIAYGSRRRVNDGAVAVAPTVRFEVLVLTVVVAVTAVLVDNHPPR